MNILRVTPLEIPSYQGRLDLSNALEEIGLNEIIMTNKQINNKNTFIIPYIKFLPITINRIIFDIIAYFKISKIAKERDIDIVIDHYGYSSLYALLRDRGKSPKYVCYIHGSLMRDINHLNGIKNFPRKLFFRIANFMNGIAYKNTDSIVAVSENAKKDLLTESNFLKKKKIFVIPNGYSKDLFSYSKFNLRKKCSLPLHSKIFLYVGNVIERKGIDYLIKICERPIKELNCYLLLIGEGENKGKLQSLTKKLGISDKVIFLGKIDREELKKYYSNSDLFVFPSLYEGSPKVIFESLACCLPFIATDVGDIKEVAEKTKAGIVVKQNNIKEFEKKLICLLKNKKKLENLRKNALKNGEIYSWENIAKRTKKVYEEIMK